MENSKMNDTFDADLTSGIAAFDSKRNAELSLAIFNDNFEAFLD